MDRSGRKRFAARGIVTVVGALVGGIVAIVESPLPEDELRVPSTSPAPPVAHATARIRPELAPTEPAPQRSVRVAVTSTEGVPLRDARVELFPGPAGDASRSLRPSLAAQLAVRSAAADDTGSATVPDVPAGRWYVSASAPGFARHVLIGTTRGADDDPVATAIALETAHAFSGTIRDEDGAPAAGIAVVLGPAVTTTWPNDVACHRTCTDATGGYRFEGVESGRYNLWYEARPGFLVDAQQLLVPGVDGLDVRRVRGARIDGTVRDADSGIVVPGARVLAFRYEPSHADGVPGRTTWLDVAAADHLGRFSLETWRRRTAVSYLLVDADGYAPGPVDDTGVGSDALVAEGQRLAFDLRVRREAILIGTLTGPDGPLAGLSVHVLPERADEALPLERPWTCITSANGGFRIDRLPAGPAGVMVFDATGSQILAREISVDLVAARQVMHDVEIPSHRERVSGRVVDEEDHPVADVDVTMRLGPYRASARTDADGQYSLDAALAPDGTTILHFRCKGFRDLESFLDRDEERVAKLQSVRAVALSVLAADGKPIAGCRVTLVAGLQGVEQSFPEWTGTRETVTARDGSFHLSDAEASHDWWLVLQVGSDTTLAEPSDESVLVPAHVRVTGSVVNGSGAHVVGALVCDDSGVAWSRTRADGRFAVDWHPGFGDLHVVSDGLLPAFVASESIEQVIELNSVLSISGTVHLPSGEAACGLVVLASRPDVGTDPSSIVDADGRFILSDLSSGSWQVTVHDPRSHAYAGASAVATAGTDGLALTVSPAATLVVTVSGPDGEELPGVTVSAQPSNSAYSWARDDTYAPGPKSFALAADCTYTIHALRDGYESAEVRDVRAGGEPLQITLRKSKP